MKHAPTVALALSAALLSGTAFAQLKLKPEPGAKAGLAPKATAQPAPAPAPVSAEAAEKQAAGQLAAAGWLTLLDRQDWGRAWDTSAAMFRSTVPLPAWMDGIPKVRAPLGAFVERTPGDSMYKTQLEGRPDGDYVTVAFNTKFDKQDVQELVTTVREADGKWRVTGYQTR